MGHVPATDQEMMRTAVRNASGMLRLGRAAGFGGVLADDVGWVIAPDVPHAALNSVRPVRQHPALADRVPEIVANYPPGVPVGWWLVSDDGFDELAAALKRRGFEAATSMPVIAGPIPAETPERPSSLTMAAPDGDDDWDAVIAVQQAGFALPPDVSNAIVAGARAITNDARSAPPIEVTLATIDDEPVAVGIITHGDGAAGLWSLSTIPSARGRGVGGAMIDHRLARARARGSTWAFMFSGGDAEPLYARRGFRRIGYAELHVLPPRD